MGPKLLASLSFCADQLSRGSLLPLFNNGQGGAREALALYYYYHLPALPPSQFNSSTLLLRRTRIGMNFSFMSPTKSNIIQQVHANQNLWKNPKKVVGRDFHLLCYQMIVCSMQQTVIYEVPG